ncbi:MAG: pentapeptide repeat-containing protein [Cutibacterium avidum]|nr:pentapeptide repeat-containing protein [Cutibacterium avidum]MDU5418769.1 pentapeptide repeat-containing protein [Cutibacterium avidum]
MNRDDVLEIIREASDRGETPNLRKANLSGVNLHGADMRKADLRDANLSWADLRGANLREANLCGADLSWANLREADLRGANLREANLRGAKLRGANLSWTKLYDADLCGANLSWANLRGAKLRGANLRGGLWGGLCIDGLHPYRCLLVPTPDGWEVTIGCWSGTVPELRSLIASDDGWPEATGEQIAERRPLLSAFCDLCDVHMAAHPGVIDDLAARWSA